MSMQDSSSCAYLAAPVRQHNGGPDSVGGPASTLILQTFHRSRWLQVLHFTLEKDSFVAERQIPCSHDS